MFEFDLRLRGLAYKIKAGEYAIRPALDAHDATILVDGKSHQHKPPPPKA